MARPERHRLANHQDVDLTPLASTDPMNLSANITKFVHLAASEVVRRQVMTNVNFPVDDMLMFLVVNQLSLRGGMRATDLAKAVQTGRPNLSQVVQRLEGLNLAQRVADPDDNRGVLVALTETGRELGGRIVAYDLAVQAALFADWSDADTLKFSELFARLMASLERLYP